MPCKRASASLRVPATIRGQSHGAYVRPRILRCEPALTAGSGQSHTAHGIEITLGDHEACRRSICHRSRAVAVASSISSQSTFPIPQASGAMINGLHNGISTVGSRQTAVSWGGVLGGAREYRRVRVGCESGKHAWKWEGNVTGCDWVDSHGSSRLKQQVQCFDRKHAVVGARLDDFTVALRSGSVYALRLSLDRYAHPATSNIELNLAEGRESIAARFDGQGARLAPGDMRGALC